MAQPFASTTTDHQHPPSITVRTLPGSRIIRTAPAGYFQRLVLSPRAFLWGGDGVDLYFNGLCRFKNSGTVLFVNTGTRRTINKCNQNATFCVAVWNIWIINWWPAGRLWPRGSCFRPAGVAGDLCVHKAVLQLNFAFDFPEESFFISDHK